MALLPSDIWVGRFSTTTDPTYGLVALWDAKALPVLPLPTGSPIYSPLPLLRCSVGGSNHSGRVGEGPGAIYSFTMNFNFRRADN